MRAAVGLLLALLLVGCRQQTPDATAAGFTISLRGETAEAVVGPTTLYIRIVDAQGQVVTNAEVKARGDMNHAGMVPVLADAVRVENEEYVVPFEWTMAGAWIVEITAKLPDGTTISEKFDRSVARPSTGTG
jgi:hypothetical protein